MDPIRCFLFVPGDSERKLAKAEGIPADALILDLEDSVNQENLPLGDQAVWPAPPFRSAASQHGFSNLGSDPVIRKLPLLVTNRETDTEVPSFGLALVQAAIQADEPPMISSGNEWKVLME